MKSFQRLYLTALATCTLVAAFCLGAQAANADEYLLAVSKTHKLTIVALGGDQWCTKDLRLEMRLDKDSPDSGNQVAQINLMNRLKTPITTDCKAATSVSLTVIDPAHTIAKYSASDKGSWVFAANVPPNAVAQVANTPANTIAPLTATALGGADNSDQAKDLRSSIPVAVATNELPGEPIAATTSIKFDYPHALLRWIKDHPEVLNDDRVLSYWAKLKSPNRYNASTQDEFQRHTLLQEARIDLSDEVQANGSSNLFEYDSTFRLPSYDFSTHSFPLNFSRTTLQTSMSPNMSDAPRSFLAISPELSLIAALPLNEKQAKTLLSRRGEWGTINRNIYATFVFSIPNSGFAALSYGQSSVNAQLQQVSFYSDEAKSDLLFEIKKADFDRLRADQEAKQRAIEEKIAAGKLQLQHQQAIALRDQNISRLRNTTTSVRLANFMNEGPLADVSLDSEVSARATALITQHPANVTLMLQANGNGHENIGTLWPKHLKVTLADGLGEMKSSGWYLVKGTLTVPDDQGITDASLNVTSLYACVKDQCAEAADPTTIVDRKIASFSTNIQ